jgi:ligand-binding SRPBCC domain-containing protein
VVGARLDEAFAFFGDPWNLERITPPWLHFRILEAPPELRPGSLLRYRLRLFVFPISWTTRIEAWEPPTRFVDVQLRGPYRLWEHTHELEAVDGGTLIRDRVRYATPAGAPVVARLLRAIFDYRARVMRDLLGAPERCALRSN